MKCLCTFLWGMEPFSDHLVFFKQWSVLSFSLFSSNLAMRKRWCYQLFLCLGGNASDGKSLLAGSGSWYIQPEDQFHTKRRALILGGYVNKGHWTSKWLLYLQLGLLDLSQEIPGDFGVRRPWGGARRWSFSLTQLTCPHGSILRLPCCQTILMSFTWAYP